MKTFMPDPSLLYSHWRGKVKNFNCESQIEFVIVACLPINDPYKEVYDYKIMVTNFVPNPIKEYYKSCIGEEYYQSHNLLVTHCNKLELEVGTRWRYCTQKATNLYEIVCKRNGDLKLINLYSSHIITIAQSDLKMYAKVD
jgi:hypothetical protein